jgi:phosphatidate cytidylyltransferase
VTATLVPTAAATIGSTLAVSGASIVVVQVVRRRPLIGSTLVQRWLTWAVLGPLWLLATAWAPGRGALLTAFAAIAAVEFARLRPGVTALDRSVLVAVAAVSVPLAAMTPIEPLVVLLAGVLIGLAAPLLEQDVENGATRIGTHVIGVALIVTPFIALNHLAGAISTSAFFALGLATALSDVVAFVIGSSFGRRRLAPALSPGKTVAGAVGNLLGATLGVVVPIAAGIVPPSAIWMAPVVATGALAGDLFVSLLKRSCGVKDAGSWLPGFGGLLDRVDSLLVSSLLTLVVASITGGFS